MHGGILPIFPMIPPYINTCSRTFLVFIYYIFRLQAYNKVSRNLLNLATFTGSDEFLFAGPSDILKVLTSLPQSEHDPFSFNVELISYTVSIKCNG